MLFSKETYIQRRECLRRLVGDGLILLPGNNDTPMNYPANTYKRRQDSTFLYYYGLHRDGLAAVIDCESGQETLFGDDIDIEDIVWYGSVTDMAQMAEACGVSAVRPLASLGDMLKGRKVHFLPPYRHDTQILLMDLLGLHPSQQRSAASLALIHAVVQMRSVKSEGEIAEIERACAIGYKMHTAAMMLGRQGVTDSYVSGVLDGIAASNGSITSFQNIVTMHGEILHGVPVGEPLRNGRLMLCDCGAETTEHYCSDHTRTTPVNGRFDARQADIYDIVVDCHDLALDAARPGNRWWDVHMAVCRLMTDRLKALGLMKGDTEEAVRAGAHALFMPHGLGHMMGMDVHDMEGLGQIYVGYDDETRPSSQFGTASLRMARRLEEGFVITDEPGIYFIPDLIDHWRAEGINADFLCFDEIEKYKDFGGIRIEDDVLITKDGCRFLGEELIPYKRADVERYVAEHRM